MTTVGKKTKKAINNYVAKNQIIEHNKKVAQVWEEEKCAKLDRIIFYFIILPAIGYLEFHIALLLIRLLYGI